VIGTNCTGSCKSNYHMIMTTTAPVEFIYYKGLLTIILIHRTYAVFRFIRCCDSVTTCMKRMVNNSSKINKTNNQFSP